MTAGRLGFALVLFAAALTGAAGLALEALALGCLGLVLGQGEGALWGLGTWLAAWAGGAWLSGRRLSASARTLALLGLGSALAGPVSIHGLLALAGGAPRSWAGPLGVALVALPAALQGAILPQLLRRLNGSAQSAAGGSASSGRDSSAAWLLGANLAGGVAGVALLGHQLVGAAGRPAAAWAAGACAAAAAWIAAVSARGVDPAAGAQSAGKVQSARAARAAGASPASGLAAVAARRAGLAWALLTGWTVASQWVLLRTASLTFGGMQPALTAILLAAPLALAIGAGPLALVLLRLRSGLGAALVLAAVGALVCTTPTFIGWVEAAGSSEPWLGALVLCAPMLVPLGALLPLLHARVSGERGRVLGELLGWEVAGALAFVPAIQRLLLPAGGLPAVLAMGPILGAVAALVLAGSRLGPRSIACAGVLAGIGLWTASSPSPALASAALTRPEFQRLAFDEDANFAVTVVDDQLRSERTLLTDDFRATATGDDYMYMRALGHLPLLLHPAPAQTGVLAFGTGTTAGAAALHRDVESLRIFELSASVLEFAPYFEQVNGGVLDDPRVQVVVGDGRRSLRELPQGLDVLTMEPLLPDSPFGVYLYTAEFYATVRLALRPGGLLCQWVPPHALRPGTFDAVVGAFSGAFPWSGVFLFGTQVLLVGGDSEPELDPARFPASGPAHGALTTLGMSDPSGLASRFICAGWPAPARALTDADPWVLFAPKAPGMQVLSWLPGNLATLRGREQPLPLGWAAACGEAGAQRLAGVRELHRAREAFERTRYRLPGAEGLADFATHAGRASGILGEDPEWLHLARVASFETRRAEGLGLLRAGQSRAALAKLLAAAEQRPERADVHLFVALAADGAGQLDVALAALRRSLEQCPRVLETRPGRLAVGIGFSPRLVEALARMTTRSIGNGG